MNGMKNEWMEGREEGKKDRWMMDRRTDEDTDKQRDTRCGQNVHAVPPGKTKAHTAFPWGSQNPQVPAPFGLLLPQAPPQAWTTQEVTAEEHGRWGTGPRLY